MLKDFERIRGVKRAAEGRLLAIPGVHAVGVGRKIVAGHMTDDSCIMVFVVTKRPLADLPAGELIPAVIEGVKTDVYERPVPRYLAGDVSTERPVFGGVQIEPGGLSPYTAQGNTITVQATGLGGLGTLGCLALTGDSHPKVVAITCHHVLATPVQATKSTLNVGFVAPNLAVTGANLAGSLVALYLGAGGGQWVFYRTLAADNLQKIAAALVTQITGLKIAGLTAAVTPAGSSTVQLTASSALTCKCNVYDPPTGFQDAGVVATVSGTSVSLTGQASQACAAYLNLNLGGVNPTYGVYVPIAAGATAATVASSFLTAVTTLKTNVGQPLSGVTAISMVPSAPGDPQLVGLSGVQAIDCFVAADSRVGQPDNSFCSKCCKICDDRIGVVIDARIDVDAALIQLDPAYVSKYRAEISGIGIVKDVHDIHLETMGYALQKSGITTGVTHGTLLSLDESGTVTDSSDPRLVPGWTCFGHAYTGGFSIAGAGFAEQGDSGSAVVTDRPSATDPSYNQVAGILFAGGGGSTTAMPIQSVLAAFPALKLKLATATAAGVDVPVPAVAFTNASPMLAPALTESLQRIAATPAGRQYDGLVRRHFAEARTLVNSNRRVATVWHRNGGPEILNGLLGMLGSPQAVLPAEVHGRPLADCLDKIQSVFAKYCSPRMAADMELHAATVRPLARLTCSEMIEALSELAAAPEHRLPEYGNGR
jgi:hypothetical protein